MRQLLIVPFCLVFLLTVASTWGCGNAAAAQPPAGGLASQQEMLFDAVAAYDGIRIVPATDAPPLDYTEEHGASQVLEIIRTRMEPITVGRLSLSCSCMQATMDKRAYGQGERAFIVVRKVKPSPRPGATFALFAQLTAPYKAALQYDIQDFGPGVPVMAVPVQESVLAPARSVAVPPPAGQVTQGSVRASPVQAPTFGFKFEDVQPYQPRR